MKQKLIVIIFKDLFASKNSINFVLLLLIILVGILNIHITQKSWVLHDKHNQLQAQKQELEDAYTHLQLQHNVQVSQYNTIKEAENLQLKPPTEQQTIVIKK